MLVFSEVYSEEVGPVNEASEMRLKLLRKWGRAVRR
jgi:hypothetical protein